MSSAKTGNNKMFGQLILPSFLLFLICIFLKRPFYNLWHLLKETQLYFLMNKWWWHGFKSSTVQLFFNLIFIPGVLFPAFLLKQKVVSFRSRDKPFSYFFSQKTPCTCCYSVDRHVHLCRYAVNFNLFYTKALTQNV